ncbi:MAG: DegT/DnrJ/EryC1/StrS family aminotransferase, partial [bacterium]
MTILTKTQPAIHGGIPVRKEFLDFSRPCITDDEKKAVLEVLESGWLTTGIKSSIFEKNFAAFVGTKYALSVNSCTAGLFLILKVLGIK